MKVIIANPLLLLNPKSLSFRCHLKTIALILIFISGIVFANNADAQNAITAENALAGAPSSEWDIVSTDRSIQGFATDLSVNKGQTVRFKIKTDASAYTIKIYRIGYYQGNGARKVADGVITAQLPQIQPLDLYDPVTGKVDCSNWGESANWAVPSTAVSGVYLAKLTRTDNGGSSHIIFIVRDDAGASNFLFKTSDATWQAYNNYGGTCFYENMSYGGISPISVPGFSHATKVSYNRPFNNPNGSRDWFTIAEYPMVRWMERNGYDVSYTTQVDMSRNATVITPARHKVLLSVGHDEYWSIEERNKFENARNAGVSLGFFSGNEVYWKTRWEDNYRTLVCYKEGKAGELICNIKCDPLSTVWTGLWRSGCEYPSADGCRPENSLTGQMSWAEGAAAIEVPDTYKNLRFWRNTSIAALGSGQKATLAPYTLGFEFDSEQSPQTYPAGRITMSNTFAEGRTHKLSLYRHNSGALVFGAGTIQWSWGLDAVHGLGLLPSWTSLSISKDMQQATVNLFADMGVQPANLQTDLIQSSASTDTKAPTSAITFPAPGASLEIGKSVSITGTASDIGGVVAGVEVSVDGGVKWEVANGTNQWSYSWTPTSEGTVTIRTRSFDDIGNIESTASSNTVQATVKSKICPCTLFNITDAPAEPLRNDGNPLELGIKFKPLQDGVITGMRFYKGIGTTGTHTAHLWNTAGTLLTEATFINESASGWQEVSFATPISVTSGTTYVASMFSSDGYYAVTNPFFTQQITNGPLLALANGQEGFNGVYKYSPVSTFPTDNFQSSNYWVDVVFNTAGPTINLQPTSVDICVGANATFNSGATGSPTPTVQWQQLNGTTWTNIAGANSSSLTFVTNLVDNGKQFRAVWTSNGISLTSSVATLSVTQVIASVLNKTNASCVGSDGTIAITQNGGTSPYTYSLNGASPQTSSSFSNLIAGNYSVKVTDAKGCSSTVQGIVITQASNLAASLTSQSNASCGGGGGSASVIATGGTPPYQYSINGIVFQPGNTFSSLIAGLYTITVKDSKGCTATVSGITISQNSSLIASVSSKTTESCKGNDASFSISSAGGTSPYQYSLNGTTFQTSNTFSNIASGTYTITVKDAQGCSTNLSVAIVKDAAVTATLSSKTNAGCVNDGVISVAGAGGVAPYSYSIDAVNFKTSGTFSGLAPAVYNVIVKDARGCTYTLAGTSIIRLSTLTVAVTSKIDPTCGNNDGSITVSASGGSAPYQYSDDGLVYQTSNTFSSLYANIYNMTVKDSKGCISSVSVVLSSKNTTLNASVSSIVSASCKGNDGLVTVSASGGNGPYWYTIDGDDFQTTNTFSNLTSDTINIGIVDTRWCVEVLAGIVVPQNAPLTSSISSKTNASCNANDGSITIAAQGGSTPYTYSTNGVNFSSGNTLSNLAAGTYTVTVKDARGCTSLVQNITITKATATTVSLVSKTDATCTSNDGSIAISASAGTAPYSYSINGGTYQSANTFSNLVAGAYTISAKDSKGCSASLSVTLIAKTSNLSALLQSKSNASCNTNDGTITITASGGTPPYQYSTNGVNYQASNVLSGLADGTYNIKVKDAKGCIATVSNIVILEIVTLTATVSSQIDVTCNGAGNDGSITMAASGGVAPYKYRLNSGAYQTSNSFTKLTKGTYSVTVLDAKGCTKLVSGIAVDVNVPVATLVSKTNVSCKGNDGSFTIAVSGGTTPYTYSLNGGSYVSDADNVFSGLNAGTHRVTVKDAKGCTSSITGIVISVAADLNVSVVTKTNACSNVNNGSITVQGSGGIPPYTYRLNSGNYSSSNTFSNLSPGTYYVVVKDAKSCTDYITGITISRGSSPCSSNRSTQAEENTSINSKTNSETLSNPGTCKLEVTLNAKNPLCYNNLTGTVTSTVTGNEGKVLYKWSNGQTGHDLTRVGEGSYYLTVTDKETGCVATSETVKLTNPDKLIVSAKSPLTNGYNISCKDGKTGNIELVVEGGSGKYSYTWSNGATTEDLQGLQAGKYSVIVKDEMGCSAKAEVVLSEPTENLIVNSKTEQIDCNTPKGSISVSAEGGVKPYAYTWSDGTTSSALRNASPAAYSVKVKDAAGCELVEKYDIKNYNLGVQLSTEMNKINPATNDSSTKLIATTSGELRDYKYSWSSATDSVSRERGNFIFVNPAIATDYSVTITDISGCTATSVITVKPVKENLGSRVIELSKAAITVSPNPSDGNFKVALMGFEYGKVEIKIIDETGKEVTRKPVEISAKNQSVPFNLTYLSKGLYFVNVVSDKGIIKEKIILK